MKASLNLQSLEESPLILNPQEIQINIVLKNCTWPSLPYTHKLK